MALPVETKMNPRRGFFDRHADNWEKRHDRDAEREQIRVLVSEMGLMPGWTVVEPGCGTGQVSEELATVVGVEGLVLGLDISRNMLLRALEKALTGSRFVQADASAVPVSSGSAQAVVLFRVFPHLDDSRAALAEIRRVLEPGGRLVIAHTAGRERLNRYHARAGEEVARDIIPEENEMRALLADAGFLVERIVDREDRFLVLARGSV